MNVETLKRVPLPSSVDTVFPRIDAAAFIYFVGQFGAATIRGQRLFEGGVYSFRQYDPRLVSGVGEGMLGGISN